MSRNTTKREFVLCSAADPLEGRPVRPQGDAAGANVRLLRLPNGALTGTFFST